MHAPKAVYVSDLDGTLLLGDSVRRIYEKELYTGDRWLRAHSGF